MISCSSRRSSRDVDIRSRILGLSLPCDEQSVLLESQVLTQRGPVIGLGSCFPDPYRNKAPGEELSYSKVYGSVEGLPNSPIPGLSASSIRRLAHHEPLEVCSLAALTLIPTGIVVAAPSGWPGRRSTRLATSAPRQPKKVSKPLTNAAYSRSSGISEPGEQAEKQREALLSGGGIGRRPEALRKRVE